MLSVNRFYELPLELHIQIAMMDEDVWIKLWLYNSKFNEWSRKKSSIELFNDLFTKKVCNGLYTVYILLGITHNLRGPAWYFHDDTYRYFVNNNLHRVDGPAIVDKHLGNEYWQYGLRHRTDGPAVIHKNGRLEYWQNGQLHRNDGPAIVYPDGRVEYWRNGEMVNEYIL